MRLVSFFLLLSWSLSAQSPIAIKADGVINLNFPTDFNAKYVEDMHYDSKRKQLYIYGQMGRGAIGDGLRIDPQVAAISFDLSSMPSPKASSKSVLTEAHFFVDQGKAECSGSSIHKIYPLGDYIGTGGGALSIHSKANWTQAVHSSFYCKDYWGGSRTYGYFKLPNKRFVALNYNPAKKELNLYGIKADGSSWGGKQYSNNAYNYFHPCPQPDASGSHYLLSSWTDGIENVRLRLMKLAFSGTDNIKVEFQSDKLIDLPLLKPYKDPASGDVFDVRSSIYSGLLSFYFLENKRPRNIYENSLLRWNKQGNLVWTFHTTGYPASWGNFYAFEFDKSGTLKQSMPHLNLSKIRTTQAPLTVDAGFDRILNVYTWKSTKDYSRHYYVDVVDMNNLSQTKRLHFKLDKNEFKRIMMARHPDKPDYYHNVDDVRTSAFLVSPNKGYLCIVLTAAYGPRSNDPLAQLVLLPFSL